MEISRSPHAPRHAVIAHGFPMLTVRQSSERGADGIPPDLRVGAGLCDGAKSAARPLEQDRLGYVHIALGQVTVNGVTLEADDVLLATISARVAGSCSPCLNWQFH